MMPSLSIWLPLVRRDPGARFSQSRNVRVRSKPETRRNEAMKTINMLVLAVFATLLASALAVATEPRDDSGKPKTGGTTEKKQGYAAVNGLKMYYEIHGTGKPLVVLHGAFGWATVQPTLAKDRQVIAVELQGHGHTADIDRPLTYEQMADDTAALLKELKIEQADFFGYSMGGNVALAVAIRHPKLVRKVAINGSHYGRIEDAYDPETLKQFKTLSSDFAPAILKAPYDKVAPDPKQWPMLVAKVKKMGLDFTGFAREDMKSIKADVLITLGDRDAVRPEHAVEMFRLIPNAQLAVFPGGDHFTLWTNPDKVLVPIATFLDAPMSETKERDGK
jgi:pimeloyl-ACP methyl ester carboxylesterase